MRRKPVVVAVAATALALAATALAAPSNGGFEKGNFNGWELKETGGDWHVYNEADGFSYNPQVGDYAAAIVPGEPGANFLHRTLDAEDGRYLSFYLAYDNEGAGEFASPKNFRFGNQDFENQQARVDLLAKDAKLKSLKNSDILKTLFRTKENSELTQPYEFYFVDLKEEGIKGKFQFRLAEVDNIGPWFVGIDQLFLSDRIP